MISQLTVHEDVNTGRHSNDDINRLELFWETEKTLIMHKLSKVCTQLCFVISIYLLQFICIYVLLNHMHKLSKVCLTTYLLS